MMRNFVGMNQVSQQAGVFLGDAEFKALPSERLLSSIDYQRDIEDDRVMDIAHNFDINKANPPKISLREGVYRIMDGAHTLAAMKVVNKGKPFDMVCRLYHGLSVQQEAELFASQHENARRIPFRFMLNAEFTAENPEFIAFREITEKTGLKLELSGRTAPYKIGALAKAWSVFSKNGPEFYEKMLHLVVSTWGGESWSLQASILGGVSAFMKRYPDFDEKRFVKYLSVADENMLIRGSVGIQRSRDIAFAVAIAKLYNTRAGKKTVNIDLLFV